MAATKDRLSELLAALNDTTSERERILGIVPVGRPMLHWTLDINTKGLIRGTCSDGRKFTQNNITQTQAQGWVAGFIIAMHASGHTVEVI